MGNAKSNLSKPYEVAKNTKGIETYEFFLLAAVFNFDVGSTSLAKDLETALICLSVQSKTSVDVHSKIFRKKQHTCMPSGVRLPWRRSCKIYPVSAWSSDFFVSAETRSGSQAELRPLRSQGTQKFTFFSASWCRSNLNSVLNSKRPKWFIWVCACLGLKDLTSDAHGALLNPALGPCFESERSFRMHISFVAFRSSCRCWRKKEK